MEFTNTDKTLFEQIADTLGEKGAYLPTVDIAEVLKNYNIISDRREISTTDGSSKCVVIFNEKDYVLKWSNDNSVLMEFVIYQKAVKKGIAFLFPETILLGAFHGIYYSIQQKIDYSARRIPARDKSKYVKMTKTVSYTIYKKMENGFQIPNCGYNRDLHELWAKVFLSLYGKAIAKRLCAFIQENRINDLHSSNIGFLNRRPILLDFCGYENDIKYY